jgi:small subunit ribosomal protein S13
LAHCTANNQVALTSFYGLSHATTPRLLARLQIPTACKVSDLTESQITSLSAFLSSPSTTPPPPPTPLSRDTDNGKGKGKEVTSTSNRLDPLEGLRIETDLKRDTQGDIAHLRQVGAYRGRRYVQSFFGVLYSVQSSNRPIDRTRELTRVCGDGVSKTVRRD